MDIWSPEVGDQLILRRDPENVLDVNAVSVLTEMDHVVSHLPKLMVDLKGSVYVAQLTFLTKQVA